MIQRLSFVNEQTKDWTKTLKIVEETLRRWKDGYVIMRGSISQYDQKFDYHADKAGKEWLESRGCGKVPF